MKSYISQSNRKLYECKNIKVMLLGKSMEEGMNCMMKGKERQCTEDDKFSVCVCTAWLKG